MLCGGDFMTIPTSLTQTKMTVTSPPGDGNFSVSLCPHENIDVYVVSHWLDWFGVRRWLQIGW